MSCFKKKVKAFAEDNRGVSMVEFAFIVIVLLIIVLGTIEFGLIWYTKYVMACATREGARYATLYQPDSSGNRILPCNLVPTIETFVQNYLKGALPPHVANACVVTLPDPTTCYTAAKTGQNLTVRVTCSNPMDLLGGFLPFMKSINLRAETIMKCE